MKNDKGFALIELMIVFAIICIVAAVAIPELASYRDRVVAEKIMKNLVLTKDEQARYQKNLKEITQIIEKEKGEIANLAKGTAEEIKKAVKDNTEPGKQPQETIVPKTVAEDNHAKKPDSSVAYAPESVASTESVNLIVVWFPRGYKLEKSEWDGDDLKCYICKVSDNRCEWVIEKNVGRNKKVIFKEE